MARGTGSRDARDARVPRRRRGAGVGELSRAGHLLHAGGAMRTYGRLAVSRTRLVELLRARPGEASAITGDDLAVLLRCKEEDNRSLREAIDELILDGYPIGSAGAPRGGYRRV